MAREPEADSRPISVAELMARARELDGASTGADGSRSTRRGDDADADVDATSDGSSRRRRGGGSVSFAELTGELPKLTEPGPRSARRAVGSDDDAPEPISPSSDGESRFVPDEPTPAPGRGFPRSESPRPTSEPDVFPRSEIPVGRAPEPTRTTSWASPDQATPPATRDISSGAIQDRFHAARRAVGDDAVETGIIPRVETGSGSDLSAAPTGSLDAADLDHLTPQEREREFERYRNFEDIDALDEPEPEPKKRRGLFGGRLRGRSAQPETSPTRADHDERTPDDAVDDSARQWEEQPWSRWPTDDAAATDPDVGHGTRPQEARDHLRDSGDFDFADDRHPDLGLTDDRDNRSAATTAFDAGEPFPRDDLAGRGAPTTSGRRRRDDEAETQVVDLDKAQFAAHSDADTDTDTDTDDADRPSGNVSGPESVTDDSARRRRSRAAKGAALDAAASPGPATDAATTGPSPARQWAMLGIQVLVGLVVGVGLFLGFHELWKWNVYFALVLAVVVMFGMVTTVHVVRRSQDLISTLLALGVGLIVTIGPLVLLASGS